jgi:hypothetical protein
MIGRLQNLVSKGFWPHSGPTVATGLTATGATSQANSFGLDNAEVAIFTTTAATTGCRLPASVSPGDVMVVANRGASALLIYPAVGHNINALAANASLSLAAGSKAMLVATSATNWLSIVTT